MRKRSAAVAEVVEEGTHTSVREASEVLAEEIRKADAPRRIEFENANKAHAKDMAPDFERITESIFVAEPFKEYKLLEEQLKVGDERGDHGSVNRSLDLAETRARRAHSLWMTAKRERDRWELDNAVVFAAMRNEAHKILQQEKDQKIRNKMITDADVESMCAMLFPEEWRHQELKRKDVKRMEDSMANLCEVWLSRCRSLQAMLAKQR